MLVKPMVITPFLSLFYASYTTTSHIKEIKRKELSKIPNS
jgi:hypothetical protein